MAIKVAIIGAGSYGFTRALFRDILTVPEFKDTVFAFTPPAGATKIAFKPRRTIPGSLPQGGGAQP